ncbi:peptidyl-prolyl cis-trans isomerase G [Drosophila bipectinata]|uniref:peptidyl-prolyl cis-trans isomerase G n=1 Tax=Drosophila bipectinata TaxID=42026 RepID=UPI0038B30C29
MSQALVNEETLENLTFQRSKKWASHLKHLESIDDGEELDASDFEDLFQDEGEDPGSNDSEAEAVEDNNDPEANVDIGNIHNVTANMSAAELTLMLCAGENNEAKAEMEEILNQTIPIVQEHKRKWKEAGLDRILDTFDENQIEKHVGEWMQRHNSVYIKATEQKRESIPLKYHRYPYERKPRWSDHDQSDNESLHSIDTARYIRQSRRCMTNKLPNLTTIKMYRKHSHKRDELRAKYAYDDEQEHRHHMQTLLHRRREKKRHLAYLTSSPRHCRLSVTVGGHHSRRKHLSKRRADSSLFDSSSSDEDDHSFGGCDCRNCRRQYALSRSSYQCCSYRGLREEYMHSASRSFHHMRHYHRQELDIRPRVRENECSCCNSDRLCSQAVHIANSSTEEWVVENNSPVELPPHQTPSKCRKLVAVERTTPQSVRYRGHLPHSSKSKVTPSSKLQVQLNYKERISSEGDSSDSNVARSKKPIFEADKKSKILTTPKSCLKSSQKSSSTTKRTTKQKTTKTLPKIAEEEVIADATPRKRDSSGQPTSKKGEALSNNDSTDVFETLEQRSLSESKHISSKRSSTILESGEKSSGSISLRIPVDVSHIKPLKMEEHDKTLAYENEIQRRGRPKKEKKETDTTAERERSLTNEDLTSENKVERRGRPKKEKKETNTTAERERSVTNEDSEESSEGPVLGRRRLVSFSESRGRPSRKARKEKELETEENLNKERKVKTKTKEPEEGKKPKTNSKLSKKSNPAEAKLPKKSNPVESKPKSTTKGKESTRPPRKEATTNISPDSQSNKHKENNLNELSDSDEDLKKALLLSKKTYQEEQLQRIGTKNQASQSPVEQSQGSFNNQSVACNSTALANDTACKRVLPKKRGPKTVASVTSSEQTSIIDLDSTQDSLDKKELATNGEADCTAVTSTTAELKTPPPLKITKQGILLHSPTSEASSGGAYTLTEQGLGRIIGERLASKYIKYHIGSKSFDSSHSVYYKPTPKMTAVIRAQNDPQTMSNIELDCSSSDSDDDIFENIERYGLVYSVLEKN